MSTRAAIRHTSAVESIRAYLRIADRVLRGSHIIGYMQLMHAIAPATTSRTLQQLVRRGEVARIQRSWYRWIER